jgi:hypothetical protein
MVAKATHGRVAKEAVVAGETTVAKGSLVAMATGDAHLDVCAIRCLRQSSCSCSREI